MVDVAQRQRATFPTLDNVVDAVAKYRSDYDRANTEYNRFHARSEPAAQLAEQAAYADPSRMNPTFVNARSPRVYRNTQYSPNYPGDKYTTKFKVGSGGNRGLKSLPRGEYYDDMKDTYDFLMNEMYKPDARRYMDLEPYSDKNNVDPRLGADLNLQDVMDLYESLGLDLNTHRFIRKANKAGVQVSARGGIMSL